MLLNFRELRLIEIHPRSGSMEIFVLSKTYDQLDKAPDIPIASMPKKRNPPDPPTRRAQSTSKTNSKLVS
jgi:hypothetical protein